MMFLESPLYLFDLVGVNLPLYDIHSIGKHHMVFRWLGTYQVLDTVQQDF